MKMVSVKRLFQVALLVVAGFTISLTSSAADRTNAKLDSLSKSNAIGLFTAMQNDQIEVQFIPKSSKQATILIRNNTKKPLAIAMPAVFAGVPVLHQFGGGGMGGMGGGMGGMGGGGMGGGGMFNLAPEKVRKLRITTVCLEHGKKEPNPRIKYVIVPIEMFPQKPEVIELGKMLSTGKLDQSAAQAAVWHHTDGLTWRQLAQKVGIQHLNGTQEPYFQPQQLNTAVRLSAIARWRVQKQAALQQTAAKPSESLRDK